MTPLKFSWLLILVTLGLALSATSLRANESENQEPVRNRSPSPPAREQPQRETKQQTSDTQDNPLPPWKSLNVSQFETNPKKEAIEQHPQELPHWLRNEINWSGWVQVLVAAIGLYIIWRTLKAIERQVEANRIAANAATDANQIARESMIGAQRAFIKITFPNPGLSPSPPPDSVYQIFTDIENIGQTPTRVTDIRFTFKLRYHGQALPTVPDHTESDSGGMHRAFLHKNDPIRIRRLLPINHEDEDAIQSKAKDLYVYGYVDYIDQFSQRHRAGYAWCYEPGSAPANLFIVAQSEYNYDRPRQQGEGSDWDTPI